MGLFDKIKDVIGDIAPVVLPVAINAFLPGLGTVASGALGAGIGTLLQGGDAKDALKSAALGGGIGALKVGFMGDKSFADNLRADFKTTKGFFSQPLRESASTLVGGVQKPFQYDDSLTEAGQRREAFEKLTSDEALGIKPILEKDQSLLAPRSYTDPEIRASQDFKDLISTGDYTRDEALAELKTKFNPSVLQRFGVPAALGLGAMTLFSEEEEEDELDPLETFDPEQFRLQETSLDPMRFMPTMKDIQVPYTRNFKDGGIATIPNKYKGFSKLPEAVQQKISPTLAEKYAEGGVVGGLMNLSEQSRQMADHIRNMPTGMGGGMDQGGLRFPFEVGFDDHIVQPINIDPIDFFATESDDYIQRNLLPNAPQNPYGPLEMGKTFGARSSPFRNVTTFEDGGEVDYFPRRNGGIGPGEGSGTKDDVPAMLMDGEFVMTRNAVKAAGGGNIEKGIDNMYGLMRNLEART
jgi:hypothetical protein